MEVGSRITYKKQYSIYFQVETRVMWVRPLPQGGNEVFLKVKIILKTLKKEKLQIKDNLILHFHDCDHLPHLIPVLVPVKLCL